MNEKEKAKELVDKYYLLVDSNFTEQATMYTAKQCALVCVDEIINDYEGEPLNNYWQGVKTEIELL